MIALESKMHTNEANCVSRRPIEITNADFPEIKKFGFSFSQIRKRPTLKT